MTRWLAVAEGKNPQDLRRDLVGTIKRLMDQQGFNQVLTDASAERSFVLGPPERWLLLGDSADSLDSQRLSRTNADRRSLSLSLSLKAPVIELCVSDDIWGALALFENGKEKATWQSGPYPFDLPGKLSSDSDDEANASRTGWTSYLAAGEALGDLERAFRSQESTRYEGSLAWRLADLFGWPVDLAEVGYTWNPEGVPVSYRQYVEHYPAFTGPRPRLADFVELHFARPGHLGRGAWDEPFWNPP